jgi:hypothetical protein
MPQCPHTATKRITIMPEPGIVLNSDQIGDLHELLDHAETIAQWLLHATDEIIDDLAQTAYAAHFHPRSAVFWLVEDLVHTQYRLHRALHPDTSSHDQDLGQDTHAEPAAQAATSATTSYRGRLDTSASIGNQILPPLPSLQVKVCRSKASRFREGPSCCAL